MSARSLDQERAQFAWERTAPSVVQLKDYAEFANLAAGAPALIMSNGLMQTLAFYRAKGSDKKGKPDPSKPHHHLLNALLHRLAKAVLCCRAEFDDVMGRLYGAPTTDVYLRATDEALEILKWIRQFAKARAKD